MFCPLAPQPLLFYLDQFTQICATESFPEQYFVTVEIILSF